ncbi:MAG: DUF72 domain-containing protein [Proteobacteria bacterium]|nr:DUF72 domain-containing protein [Pseudomonadota bacterium]
MLSSTASASSTGDPGRVEIARPETACGPGKVCPVCVGTCGYSYTEWVDSGFYPEGTKSAAMLGLYGRCFSVVELNYTWYQMARAEPLTRMVENAPPHLLFTAKLTRTMTHERDPNWREQLALYRQGIEPLRKRLVAVLIQLPPDFDRSLANRNYLAALLDGLSELPLAVEFRHHSWAVDSVFAELSRRRVTLVTVDVPALPGLFPALDVVTNPDLFYGRFHGRNREGWRSGNMQKKFNYDYSVEELRAWCVGYLPTIAARADRGILLFNNHVRAQAPRNAAKLATILAEFGSGERI